MKIDSKSENVSRIESLMFLPVKLDDPKDVLHERP